MLLNQTRLPASTLEALADSNFDAFEEHLPNLEEQPLTVLIVDKDEADREKFSDVLRQIHRDMRVVVCGSTELARLLIQEQMVDCVLLDFHLVGGVARGHIRSLKNAAHDDHLPVVVMSGYGSETKATSAMRNGAADYLAKNKVTPGALRRAIRNSISKADLSRTLDTERQNLQLAIEDLRRKNREVQSFYHTVSHELKTPITAIREFCSLVHDGVLGDVSEGQLDAMQTSLGCCDRLTLLVNDLFDAARVETGKLELVARPTNMVELLTNEMAVQRPWAREHQLTLDLHIEAQLPQCMVDGMRVRQVLANLIRNAVKFTEAGGQIDVSARHLKTDNCLEIRVEDNGYGISSEHAEFIFDRLYQCEPQGQASQNGMGIGLYLCSQIVHQHKGTISVDSVYGEGSVFTFTLPVQA